MCKTRYELFFLCVCKTCTKLVWPPCSNLHACSDLEPFNFWRALRPFQFFELKRILMNMALLVCNISKFNRNTRFATKDFFFVPPPAALNFNGGWWCEGWFIIFKKRDKKDSNLANFQEIFAEVKKTLMRALAQKSCWSYYSFNPPDHKTRCYSIFKVNFT